MNAWRFPCTWRTYYAFQKNRLLENLLQIMMFYIWQYSSFYARLRFLIDNIICCDILYNICPHGFQYINAGIEIMPPNAQQEYKCLNKQLLIISIK